MAFFHVVAFPDDDEDTSGIIPDSWLDAKTNMTDYPPRKKRYKVSSYVKRRTQPQSDWVVCKCRILRTYDSYAKALLGDALAQDTSDLASATEHLEPKRKRYKKFGTENMSEASISDIDESEEEHMHYPSPGLEDLNALTSYNGFETTNMPTIPAEKTASVRHSHSDSHSESYESDSPEKCNSPSTIYSDSESLPSSPKLPNKRHKPEKPPGPRMLSKPNTCLPSTQAAPKQPTQMKGSKSRKLFATKESKKPICVKKTIGPQMTQPSNNPAHHKPAAAMNGGEEPQPPRGRTAASTSIAAPVASRALNFSGINILEKEEHTQQNVTLQDVYRKTVENKRLLQNLTKEMNWMKANIQKVLNIHQLAEHPVHQSAESAQLSGRLPMSCVDDMVQMEASLTSNMDLFRNLVRELRILGGQTCGEATRRMLKHLVSDDLSTKYTFYGTSTKLKLADLKIITALKQSVRSIPILSDTDDKVIERVVKEWFRHAPQRVIKKGKN